MTPHQLIPDYRDVDSTESSLSHLSSTREVLQDVFELLEEFGPQWYTKELHDRAVAALRTN